MKYPQDFWDINISYKPEVSNSQVLDSMSLCKCILAKGDSPHQTGSAYYPMNALWFSDEKLFVFRICPPINNFIVLKTILATKLKIIPNF